MNLKYRAELDRQFFERYSNQFQCVMAENRGGKAAIWYHSDVIDWTVGVYLDENGQMQRFKHEKV